MALAEQIEAADIAGRKLRGFGMDGMQRDAILAMPAQEREAAIRELERARRCVLRVAAPEHTAELLDKLGLGGTATP